VNAPMHSLLVRQLKRAHNVDCIDVATLPAEWRSFVGAVEQAYRDGDADRALVQRSIEIASQELVERNRLLLLQNQKLQLAEREVRLSRDELEERVAARTSELRDAKDAAERNKEHFQLLLNSTGEGIYGIDNNGLCTFVNIAAAKMLGFEVSEIIGQNVHELIHYKKPDGSSNPITECPIYQNALLHQSCSIHEDVFWKRDQTSVQVEYSSHPMRDGAKVIGAVIAFSDISARKEVESALMLAKEMAERASLTKSEFLARMSHEIRTPLNGVIGMIDQLIQTEQTPIQSRYTSLARTAAESLMEVINDILDFSKIEAGKVELESVPVDISVIVGDLVELFTPIANKKHLTISGHLSRNFPPTMLGDSNRIRQILTNLVSNAIKFTSTGSIKVQVEMLELKANRCSFRVGVQDTGIGIPANRLDRLFKSFSQVDTSTTRQFGGTGLGLVICKRLTELMGGEIGVESESGVGTTFWIALSLAVPAEQPSEPKTSRVEAKAKLVPEIRGLHLLVAEDNEMNQYVTHAILKQASCTCDFANNGALAIAAFEKRNYDAILMDCQMPTVDGLEATRSIRKIEANNAARSRIPIIALTAEAVAGDRERCIAAGMDGYVSKPIRAALLFAELAKVIAAPVDPQWQPVSMRDNQ
jgi:PAS domain S-box-containing protein